MKYFLGTVLFLAITTMIDCRPNRLVNPGAGQSSQEINIGLDAVAKAQPSAASENNAGGNSNPQSGGIPMAGGGGAVVIPVGSSGGNGNSGSTSGESAGAAAAAAAGAATSNDFPDSPDTNEIDSPDSPDDGPNNGAPVVAGGSLAGAVNTGDSSTAPPPYAAGPGLIVSEGGSGISAAVIVIGVLALVGAGVGVGVYLVKRK